MNNILIAIDYDPTAQKVAESAFALFGNMDHRIILLHVIESPAYYQSTAYDPIMGFGGYVNNDFLDKEGVDRIKEASITYLDSVKDHLGLESIITIVKQGDISETILETAQEQNASLIVMGSHSRRWLEKILLGSIAEHVLRDTQIPLLIIPTKQ